MSGAGNPLPMKTGDVEIVSGRQLSAEDLGQCEGMIIEANPLAGVVNAQVQGINDLTLLDNVGVQRRRIASDKDLKLLSTSYKMSLRNPKIKEKLFPHLYPFGRGGFDMTLRSSSVKVVTHGQYAKIRLMHADPRWRHDKVWPFFAYDWVMKFRILMYNMKCPRIAIENDNRDLPLTKEYVLSDLGSGEKVHNKLGQYIPPTLPGTKKYWAKEYLDLAAFCERCGVPDFFVTLTANDNWPELKKFLNGVAPHFRPVETTVLFMQRFRALKPLLWGNKSVFGHVTDHWQRTEFQNRGSFTSICFCGWINLNQRKIKCQQLFLGRLMTSI